MKEISFKKELCDKKVRFGGWFLIAYCPICKEPWYKDFWGFEPKGTVAMERKKELREKINYTYCPKCGSKLK